MGKAYFQYDTAHRDLRDLHRRTPSDKVLCDKAFNADNCPKCDWYLGGRTSMISKLFGEKLIERGRKIKLSDTMLGATVAVTPIEELADELHKPMIRKF